MFLSRLRNKSQINLNKLSPVCILRSMLNAHLLFSCEGESIESYPQSELLLQHGSGQAPQR